MDKGTTDTKKSVAGGKPATQQGEEGETMGTTISVDLAKASHCLTEYLVKYDKEEVKSLADCQELMRLFGATEYTPGRFNCPWREGSDSGSMKVEKDTWYDHREKEGGDAITAVEKYKGLSFPDALNWLGDYLHLQPITREPLKVVAEYIYTDADGKPLHMKIRYLPKSFSQAHFTSEGWKPGLKGVQTVLYHLPEVIAAVREGKQIFQAEGEKDCDNLAKLGFIATTQAMGAGKWDPSYTDVLKGANVCIIADKDDAGRKHAELVASKLNGTAQSVKVIELPGEQVKDATDWIEAGGTAEELERIIKDAEVWQNKAPAEDAVKLSSPFANFIIEKGVGSTIVKTPRLLHDLRTEILKRFNGFPCRVGNELFDYDQQNGGIRQLRNPVEFFAWIQQKSRQPVNWVNVTGAVSKEELFSDLMNNARRYELICSVPTWPKRSEVFYSCGDLPEATPDHRHLETFLAFFSLADDNSRNMMRAFVASPLYYEPKVDRPLWVIDSDTGQGSGKSKLVEMVTYLYGSSADDREPFEVSVKSITNEQTADRVWRRLLSSTGRRKRVVMIDNVTGFLAAPSLAALITQSSISGLAPYGRGEETRKNDLTYVITSNSARFDRDLISRSVFIKALKPKDPDPLWVKKVVDYIDQFRMNIISEIIDCLKNRKSEAIETRTRFRTWEAIVMAPMIGDEQKRIAAIKANEEMQVDADCDQENAETLRKFITEKIRNKFGTANIPVFIPSTFLKQWFNEALPDENASQKVIPQLIKNWAKAEMIPELNITANRFYGNKERGLGWNVKIFDRNDWKKVALFTTMPPRYTDEEHWI